jgi:ribosome-associated toxin RatA of RatAB toxin-antitoxin module
VNVAGEATATLAAPPQRCLEVLTDFASYPQWWPGCLQADVVGGDGTSSFEVDFRFDTHSPVGTIDVRLALDVVDGGMGLHLRALAGPLQRLEGDGWTLRARDDGGTDARYELAGEMRTGLPGFVERPFASKARGVLIDAPVAALAARVRRPASTR